MSDCPLFDEPVLIEDESLWSCEAFATEYWEDENEHSSLSTCGTPEQDSQYAGSVQVVDTRKVWLEVPDECLERTSVGKLAALPAGNVR